MSENRGTNQAPNQTVLTFYSEQSNITDPGEYASLFDLLPRDIPHLVEVVQGLLIFPYAGWAKEYGIEVSKERWAELYLRTIPRMIARILEHDPSALIVPRPPDRRLYGLCRDFAVMLVSMLRHQGVPARERVGFAGYFNSELYWDHRITEYWDAARRRWRLVDPRIDEVQRRGLSHKIDFLDINRDSPFLTAGEVWQLARSGQVDPMLFADGPEDRGMAMIRYALLNDFDALDKVEMVGLDAWHDLIDKPDDQVSEQEMALLDEIADLTVHADTRLVELRACYASSAYGQAVRNRLAESLSVQA